eukprot:364416-Chlamydomonas_euryale.AAC.5
MSPAIRHERGQAYVANLDLAAVAVNIDFVTPQIAMRDGRHHGVQVLQASQYLACDALHGLQVEVWVMSSELPQVATREQLCYEIDAMVLHVLPAQVALDDVWVLEVHVRPYFRDCTLQLFVAEVELELAPRDVDAMVAVKSLVACLELAAPHQLTIAIVAAVRIGLNCFIVAVIARAAP